MIGQRKGKASIQRILHRHTFVMTQTDLEDRFIPIATAAGLPVPESQACVNGFKVDFWFPTLGLVVETDGGIAHASAIKQTEDRRRDQAHTAAGLTQLRFTHTRCASSPRTSKPSW